MQIDHKPLQLSQVISTKARLLLDDWTRAHFFDEVAAFAIGDNDWLSVVSYDFSQFSDFAEMQFFPFALDADFLIGRHELIQLVEIPLEQRVIGGQCIGLDVGKKGSGDVSGSPIHARWQNIVFGLE